MTTGYYNCELKKYFSNTVTDIIISSLESNKYLCTVIIYIYEKYKLKYNLIILKLNY